MGLTASEIMSKNLITIGPETGLRELAELMAIHKISGVLVTDKDGTLIGVVSQSDLVAQNKNPHIPKSITLFDWVIYLEGMGRLKAEMDKMAGTMVRDIMTREVISVSPDTSMEEVATIMTEKKIHTIPVVDKGRLSGVIGKLDIVRTLLG